MKKLLLLFVTIQLSVVANAYDFTENGIYFNLKSDGSLEVTGLASWTTRADILSDVTINGRTYRVTSIGAHAFEGRSDITYLSIPWSVTSIGEYAFVDCGSNLTVNIADPESWCQMQLGNEHSSPLSSAGKVLVHDIETTNIVIPEGVTSIGNFTFYQCRCMKSLTLPSSVTSIGSSAFEDCTGLTSLAMSEGLQSIGGSAFQGCTGLKTLTIPSTVNTISINAFANCSNIRNVYCYAKNVPDTHFDAFDATPTEKSTLYVPTNAVEVYKTSWPWSDFQNFIGIGSTPGDNNPKKRTIHVAVAGTLPDLISGDEKYKIEELTLTGELNGTDFKLIRDMAGVSFYFKNYQGAYYPETNGKLWSLDLSNAVIVNGGEGYVIADEGSPYYNKTRTVSPEDYDYKYTKNNCISTLLFFKTKLKSIILPQNVTTIEDGAFKECSVLTSIEIPNNVTSIGWCAFEGCIALTSITIPDGVNTIGAKAFYNCSALTSITVGSGNQYFDSRNDCNAIIETSSNTLLYGCNNTIIPNGVTSIGSYAFQACSGLTSVTIPNSVMTIGSYAFQACSGLTSVTIGNSVTSIGSSAFYGCSGLTSVTIPNSVMSIGSTAFYGTAWYNNQPDGLVYAGKIAYKFKGEMPANTHIIIKDGTLGISGSAFYSCNNLTSISIPNSVTSIGEWAFYNCSSLTSISIPNSVTCLGSYAFSSLTTIVSEIEKPFAMETNVFNSYDRDIYATATLIVPKGTKAAYQATEGWNKFTNIFEVGDVNGDNKSNNDDLNAIVSYIMGKTPANFNAKVADLNNDGKVNVADVTILVKIIKNIQ